MADVAMSEIEHWNAIAQDRSDPCRPRFYMRAVHMKFESEKQGRPIYSDREYVEIVTPGQPKSIVDRPVKPEDKARWPRAYEAFKAGQAQPLNGVPIEMANFIGPAQMAMLKAAGFMTIEDVAGASDTAKEKIGMGALEIVKKAKAFLQPAPVREQELRAELSKANAMVAGLQSQIDQLRAAMEAKNAPAEDEERPLLRLKAK